MQYLNIFVHGLQASLNGAASHKALSKRTVAQQRDAIYWR